MGPNSQYLLRFIHKISWNRKCMKRRLLIQQEFDPILHLLLAVQDTMWQKCIWELRYKAGVFFHKNWYVIFIFAYPFGKIDKTNFFLNDLGWLLRNKKLYSKIHMPNYIDFSSNRAILFKNDFFFLKDDAAAALKLASKNAFEAVTWRQGKQQKICGCACSLLLILI